MTHAPAWTPISSPPILLKTGKEKVPDYAFDCHTLKGKRKGKTKAIFFRDEQRELKPFQPGLFDDCRAMNRIARSGPHPKTIVCAHRQFERQADAASETSAYSSMQGAEIEGQIRLFHGAG